MRIQRLQTTPAPMLLAALALSVAAACSDSEKPDAGTQDTGAPDSGILPDTGMPDLGPPDTGVKLPCLFDQGGEENRGCESGEVCNIESGECVPGFACTTNEECNVCSNFDRAEGPEDCGHGFALTAWCDPDHGNVCTRSRAPCEPCQTDSDCGFVDYVLRGGQVNPDLDQNRCLDYGGGEKYCGRPNRLTCPAGFRADGETGQCFRDSGCADEPVFCPRSDDPESCPGREQICTNEVCPETNGALCVTNDLPGAPGICFGACRTDSDCPEDKPICNPNNGICGTGCTKDSCPGSQVCHLDGFCGPPCTNDNDCTMATENLRKVYGTDNEVYCNLPGGAPPRIYKGGSSMEAYRDEASCAPLGCERPVDCVNSGFVCDPAASPHPECVQGCYNAEDDCSSGEVCRRGLRDETYSREGCRALDPVDEDAGEIGICCFPGCTNRVLQCDLNEFCCAEEGSPFEDGDACPPTTLSSTIAARPGECFDMVKPPFCVQPTMDMPCDSQWGPGLNTDPDVMNGNVPFQEQEFAFGVAVGMMAVPVCGVSCDPEAPDNGCPRGWGCRPINPGCFQDADCGAAGLTCEGEDTAAMPPVPGRCKCGENGAVAAACPTAYGGPGGDLGTINFPRCRDPEGDNFGDMYCLAAYNCQGPSTADVYPPECNLQ